MRIWAIGDLHLGFSTGKWMDRFGPRWENHAERVAQAWDELVAADDLVLIPGDFSWALKPDEVAIDFRWLSDRLGKKVLIKGNHDYWWPKSKKKMYDVLPENVYALKKSAVIIDGLPLVGVRGCDFLPVSGRSQEDVEAEIAREAHELAQSIEHLATLGPIERPPIALFHYPPFPPDSDESQFTQMIEAAGCSRALYGHLHSETDWERFYRGEARGVHYQLVSCDFLECRPILIED